MRIPARVAALVTAGFLCVGAATTVVAQDGAAARVRERREQVLRRQEALRQRQDEARRARLAARQGPPATEPFTRTARIGRDGAFSLVNGSGRVTITGGAGDDVRIQATKRVWGATADGAKALLPEVEIEVTERTGAVDVRTVFPRPRALDAEVEFTITVPAGASVSVRTGSGDVTVTGVKGELRAEAVSGGIMASGVGQVRALRTLSGAVQLDNAESADLTVSTLSGPVTIRQLKARSADLRSVGGDLLMTDTDSDRVTAQSLTGRVEFTGRLARTGRYTLQSQSGDVRLTPLGPDGFEVEATAVNGTVRSDFPLTVDERRGAGRLGGRAERGVRAARGGGRGGGGARVLRGLSGAGGPLVTLRSLNGDISIARR
jgi:DUF4097 and DUF4098 domain-containing protein YvlB